MITDRLPFGVVEMKTAWVTDDPERSRQLTSAISRTPLHAMPLLDIQFIVATAGIVCAQALALVGWIVGAEDSRDSLSGPPLSDEASVVGPRAHSPIMLIRNNFRLFFAEQKELASSTR